MTHRAAAALCIASAAALVALPADAAVPDAEFAVRWDPRQGGPATPEDTLRALRLKLVAPRHFEIQYYDLPAPTGLPEGFHAILRKRLSAGESELSFKLRGSHALPAEPTLKQWRCPLGETKDRKDEVDITFTGPGQIRTAHSRSCSIGANDDALQPPAALGARPKGCGVTMTRLRAGDLKVELWRLGDGTTLLEASHPGRHDARSQQAFEREVLAPLLAMRITPLDRSKSAIGGDCAR